ncbi:MAG: hypothetical protein ACXWWX_00325 [Actinomycetota bacterium]
MHRRRSLRMTLALASTMAGLVLPLPAAAAPGDLDPSFSGDGIATVFANGSVATGVVVDPQGRSVVVGYTLDAGVDVAVARFRPDGSPDPAFGEGDGRVRLDLGGADYAFDVSLVPGGGVAIAGRRTTEDTDLAFVLRLGGRGRTVTSFGDDGLRMVDFDKRYQAANAIAVTPAGRLVIAGWTSNGTASRAAMARLLPDGSPDPSFSADGSASFNLSDAAEQLRDVLVLDDGRIVAAGEAERGAQTRFALIRVRANGSLDRDFGTRHGLTFTDLGPGADSANALDRRRDGRIVVAGSAGDDWGVARYLAGGRPDPSFGTGGEVVVPFTDRPEAAHDVLCVGLRVVVVGVAPGAGSQDLTVARIRGNGALDTSFGDAGRASVDLGGAFDVGRAAAFAPGRRLMVAGEAWFQGVPRMAASRLRMS